MRRITNKTVHIRLGIESQNIFDQEFESIVTLVGFLEFENQTSVILRFSGRLVLSISREVTFSH